MPSLRILIVEHSQARAAEVAGVVRELASAGFAMERAADLTAAVMRLNSEAPPELVLLLESRPGIWTDHALQTLRRAAPLVRVLRVSGSWCEGQNRSGRPAAGSQGIAWHLAVARLRRELTADSGNGIGSGGLGAPLTSTNEDLLLATTRPAATPLAATGSRLRVIEIHAPRAAQAEAWVAMCRGLGYITTIATPAATTHSTPRFTAHSACPDVDHLDTALHHQSTGAVLWDCDPRDLADGPRVRDFVERAAAPVIAVCGFPRPDDVESALRQGVSAVLAKPLLAADFAWHVSRLCGAYQER